MNNNENDISRKSLRKLFDDLSIEYLKPNECDKFYLVIEKIYYIGDTKIFRHFYSDIFDTISRIKENEIINNKQDKNLAKLMSNIELLYNNYKIGKTKNDITDYLKKLYDHISLEVARIDYNDKVFKKNIENSITKDVERKINYQAETIKNELDKKYNNTLNKLNESEKNYITLLGIFSSFVVAFIGGLVFSNSVLSNIGTQSIYKLILVILLLGFVLITICLSLYWFIAKMINKCETNYLVKIYLCVVVVIAILLGLLFWGWNNGVKEKRDNRIKTSINNFVERIDNKEIQYYYSYDNISY